MWYKVLVLEINAFESEIIQEKHFGNKHEAMNFAEQSKKNKYQTLIVEFGDEAIIE